MRQILMIGPLAMLTAAVFAYSQEPQPLNPEVLARTVIADLAARQFDKVTARYTDAMAKALPADKLAASWDGVISQLGAFQSITQIELEQRSGYHVVYATCSFAKVARILVLTFDAKGQFAGFTSLAPEARTPWKSPDYAKADSFEERAVALHSSRLDLPGSLTVPKGSGPFPAVVLVHGSGPNDQDETVGANKPFKDLAWGLSSRGIAVYRYVKRTKQYGAKAFDDPKNFTVKEETIDDARAAVAMLAALPEINPKRIYVAGHSLGAYVGPRIAAGDDQIAGLILMAGNTRPLEDLVVAQIQYQAKLAGAITPESQKIIDDANESAKEFRNPDLKPGMTVHMLGAALPASYVLDLRSYNPAKMAATLAIPVYVLQGERDYQVGMADFAGWKQALADKPNAQFKTYPSLNHLFIAGSGPSSPVEYEKPGHVQEDVISDIVAWIAAQK